MMETITGNVMFGILLSAAAYIVAMKIAGKVKHPLANPLLIAGGLCLIVINIFHIPIDNYMAGGRFISMLVVPATAMLGLLIYRQRKVLKEEFWAIVLGCGVGSGISLTSMLALCRLFDLDQVIIGSLLPKSVTTAIAVDLSGQLGGVSSLTVLSVMICGMVGAIVHPLLIKLFKVSDAVAIGVGFGTASHAVGTSKALEMGEIQGAVSGVSIGVAGIWTVIILSLV